MFTFMFYDHVSDEMRLRNKFSIENAFKMYKNRRVSKNHLFERPIKFTLVNITRNFKLKHHLFKMIFFFKDNYLFCYLNSYCTMNSNSDIQLAKMKDNFESISKVGVATKKPIIIDQFDVLISINYVFFYQIILIFQNI